MPNRLGGLTLDFTGCRPSRGCSGQIDKMADRQRVLTASFIVLSPGPLSPTIHCCGFLLCQLLLQTRRLQQQKIKGSRLVQQNNII